MTFAACPSPSRATARSNMHPLRQWGPAYILTLLTHILINVEQSQFSGLVGDAKYCVSSGHKFAWGSGCSGTDSPSPCVEALTECLYVRYGLGLELNCPHEFSAEKASPKREFIKRFASPRRLLDDILSLSWTESTDHMTGAEFSPVSEFQNLYHFVSGFSCKSVSSLNSKQASSSYAPPDS